MAVRLVQPGTDAEWGHARRLVEEYATSLGVDLSFQDIAHELDHLQDEYAAPSGAFVEEGVQGMCQLIGGRGGAESFPRMFQ